MAGNATFNRDEYHKRFDGIVVGGGPTGWLTALALIEAGQRICLIAINEPISDNRTVALMQGSLTFLDTLKLDIETIEDATPLETMRLIDGTKRLMRAPEVSFHASEAGFEHFALNIPVSHLVKRIKDRIDSLPAFAWLQTKMDSIQINSDSVEVQTAENETVIAKYVVGADGKRSSVREAIGIGLKQWSYDQTALVTSFSHSEPHHNISTEFHTETGPFTLVPLHGNRCSVVCVVKPEDAETLKTASEKSLIKSLEERSHRIVGNISNLTDRMTFPMTAQIADRMAKERVFLVGESGHAFPPIGAQGLNLSIRDIETLAETMRNSNSDEIPRLVEKYANLRYVDTNSRTLGVDLLNRSLLTGFLPVQIARGLGLYAAKNMPPLRKALMRTGLGAHAS